MAIQTINDPASDVGAAQVFDEWQKHKVALEESKSNEMTVRMVLLRRCFGEDLTLLKGSKTLTLSNGKKFNAKFDEYVSVQKEGLESLEEALGEEIFAKVFRYKPELINAGYKELSEEQKAIVDEFLTVKPSTPGLADKSE